MNLNNYIKSFLKFLICFLFSIFLVNCETKNDLINILKKENIAAIPLWKEWVGDYLVLNDNRIIFYTGEDRLIEYDIIKKKYKNIYFPKNIFIRPIQAIQDLSYDSLNNTIHLIIYEANDYMTNNYYLLHLDNYSWEEIPQLKNMVYKYYYDCLSQIIYFIPRKESIRKSPEKDELLVFDLKKRMFLDKIVLPDNVLGYMIFALTGSPNRMLTCYKTDNSNSNYYSFVFSSREGKLFSVDYSFYMPILDGYVPLDINRYLCIKTMKKHKSEIIEIAFDKNKEKVIALKSFYYEIYRLKKVDKNRCSFLVLSKDGWRLICFLDILN